MIVLGIESTAHTYGVGIITSEGKVLANVKSSYTSPDKGMILDEVANHHKEVADDILEKALQEAKIGLDDISYIAYSAGPGLDPCLWVGYHKAKELSEKSGKKLVGVNHCAAHLSIGKVWNQKLNEDLIYDPENRSLSVFRNKLKDPIYLYVSGVNTQIIFEESGSYHVLGETLDNGLGNILDKLGRVFDLGFPAGPGIEKLALNGKYVELPYVVKGMDVSFSGILTKVQQLYQKGYAKEDLCFSIQETCFAMLAEVVERAMAHTGKQELLLVGGVGANQRFCEMLDRMCDERGAKFFKVPMDLAGDQGAMIAWEGFLRKDTYEDIKVNPHWRVDEV
jgi:N6-L-threonylcarbamoyladenine synthase